MEYGPPLRKLMLTIFYMDYSLRRDAPKGPLTPDDILGV